MRIKVILGTPHRPEGTCIRGLRFLAPLLLWALPSASPFTKLFFACPEALRHGRAREGSKKRLTENCANRQQENREHKFHPSRRHGEDLGRGGEASWSCARNASDNFSAAFGFTPSAVASRSSVSRSQTGPQITRIATNLEKRNLQCLGSTGCQPVHLGSLPRCITTRE